MDGQEFLANVIYDDDDDDIFISTRLWLDCFVFGHQSQPIWIEAQKRAECFH